MPADPLEEFLSHPCSCEFGCRCGLDAAREQATALRQRVEDLERWKLVAIPVIQAARETATCSGFTCDAPVCEAIRLFDDAEARAALGGGG